MTLAKHRNIIALVIFCALLFAFYLFDGDLPLACPIKQLTSFPCPGCGGMRAASLLMHGHFLDAVYTNPLSVLLMLFFCLSAIWIFVDIVRGADTYWRIYHIRWSKTAVAIAVLILLFNWLWNVIKGL